MTKRALIALTLVLALFGSACSLIGGDEPEGRVIKARFSRAIQVFPGNSVRVLGVNIGRVIEVENVEDGVDVTFRIDAPDIRLPSDVQATIVPISLLGERYIQLFPAYAGGPEFTGDTIDLARTGVPAEQDELLRSLQDYFGELDPTKVAEFVSNAAEVLEGNGDDLNHLIEAGSNAVGVLANKRESLSGLIQEFNTLTNALATRQKGIGRLIKSYNVVGKTLNRNRAALEGTITGLNQAAAELASLLIEHRNPLGQDIQTLTRTMRTLSKNAEKLSRTQHWASRLFDTAQRADDRERDWLRLLNQGEPLEQLIEKRLKERLAELCKELGLPDCSQGRYWENKMPHLFCTGPGRCGGEMNTPGEVLEEAVRNLPVEEEKEVSKELGLSKSCKDAKHPQRCRRNKKQEDRDPGGELDKILKEILEEASGAIPAGDQLTGGP